MNIVFAGTPEFAAIALQALLDARHHVPLVLTQPDRAAGRGRRLQPSAVKRLAMARGLAVLQPPTLRDCAVHAAIQNAAPDAMVVAAYGLLIPRAILELPRRGAINIHPSLLPRWRGAAPIQRALIAGDAVTGISIMQMDEGLDTGSILLQEAIPIAPQDTARTLHDRLAALGARLIVDALATHRKPQPQATTGVTYAAKIGRPEARIDWSENAALIERKVRAFDPEPGAHTTYDGEMLKLWRVRIQTGESGKPGAVLEAGAHGVLVACGTDALWLVEVQRPGGRRLPIEAFVAGHPVSRGAQLG
ncbi:MAG TPA: methionyl-tRNA formyltransferase [Burkholderiales bacterium]|nr:methionyl-tRNA formyltransferase [Burkholderiales bacterium]